jgi:hypothetical protein
MNGKILIFNGACIDMSSTVINLMNNFVAFCVIQVDDG